MEATLEIDAFEPEVEIKNGKAAANLAFFADFQIKNSWLCGLPVVGNDLCEQYSIPDIPILGTPTFQQKGEIDIPVPFTLPNDFAVTIGPKAEAGARSQIIVTPTVFIRQISNSNDGFGSAGDSSGGQTGPSYFRFAFADGSEIAGMGQDSDIPMIDLPPDSEFVFFQYWPETTEVRLAPGVTDSNSGHSLSPQLSSAIRAARMVTLMAYPTWVKSQSERIQNADTDFDGTGDGARITAKIQIRWFRTIFFFFHSTYNRTLQQRRPVS